MEPPRHREISRKSAALVALICGVCGVLVFSPSIFGGYPMDDEFIATTTMADGRPRPLVGALGSLGDYFSTHWWLGHYAATDLFRPVTKLSYALTHVVHGFDNPNPALSQHCVNLALYGGVCALVPMLLVRLGFATLGVAAGGLVFAVHTVHSEAVCTLTGRAEIMAFGFGLLACYLLLRSESRSSASRITHGVLACVLFFSAFGSKESGLAWVPVGLALAWWRLGRRSLPRVIVVLLPAVVAFFWLRARMIGALPEDVPPTNEYANPLVALGTTDRALHATRILGFGIGRVLFPIRLSVDHGPAVFDVESSGLGAGFWVTIAVLGLAVAGAWRARRVAPGFLAALFAYGAFVFLTSNIVFPIGTIYAERLLFSSSVGFAVAVGALATWLEQRGAWRPALLIPLILWGSHCAVYSFRRSIWFDSTATIAVHDVRVQPDSANLQRLASVAFASEGDRGAAIEALEAATRLSPGFAASWLNLAALVRAGGDKSRAIEILRRGLEESDPKQPIQRAKLHASLATSYTQAGDRAAARHELEAAIRLDPNSADFKRRLEALRDE